MPEPCTLETRIGNYYDSGHRVYSLGKSIQEVFFVSASSAVFLTELSSLTGEASVHRRAGWRGAHDAPEMDIHSSQRQ